MSRPIRRVSRVLHPGYRISSHAVLLPTTEHLERAWNTAADAAGRPTPASSRTERIVDGAMRISVLVIIATWDHALAFRTRCSRSI